MNNKLMFQLGSLVLLSILLTGCPGPNKYILAGSSSTYLSSSPAISTDDFEVDFDNMYTWYDMKKRVIIFGAVVDNKSAKDLEVILSDILIVTPTDTLKVLDYKGSQKNRWPFEGDTVTIPAASRKFVNMIFISLKDYTRSDYGRKKRNEIIQLQLKLFNKIDTAIQLRYRPTLPLFWK